jgi:hypothetical protein
VRILNDLIRFERLLYSIRNLKCQTHLSNDEKARMSRWFEAIRSNLFELQSDLMGEIVYPVGFCWILSGVLLGSSGEFDVFNLERIQSDRTGHPKGSVRILNDPIGFERIL